MNKIDLITSEDLVRIEQKIDQLLDYEKSQSESINQEVIYDSSRLMEILGISYNTLKKCIVNGMPYSSIPGIRGYFFIVEDVVRFLRSNSQERRGGYD